MTIIIISLTKEVDSFLKQLPNSFYLNILGLLRYLVQQLIRSETCCILG